MIQFESMNRFDQLWFTSDTHYAHKNICRGVSNWADRERPDGGQSTRDFKTLDEMNDAIIKGINDNVKDNDVIVHCGDVSFGGKHRIIEFTDRVNCKNIILTFGNHDHHLRTNGYELARFANVIRPEDMQFLQFKGNKIVCCHYPVAIWHQGHKGAFHAFGHVHGSYPGLGKSYDVGIDSVFSDFGEYRPITCDEFVSMANRRDAHLESHHNSKTN